MKKKINEFKCCECGQEICTAVCSAWWVHQLENGQEYECINCFLKRINNETETQRSKVRLLKEIIIEALKK